MLYVKYMDGVRRMGWGKFVGLVLCFGFGSFCYVIVGVGRRVGKWVD